MNTEHKAARAFQGIIHPALRFCLGLVTPIVLLTGCSPAKPGASGRSETGPASKPATIVTKTGVEIVQLPAGEFTMGDDEGEDDEKPAHRVRISAFYMDVSEITQASYAALMGVNPSKHESPQQPVEQLGWYAAIRYCNMRSLKEGLTPCYNLDTMACDFSANGYRLPTEAEWEYACRARTQTAYSFGDNPRKLAAAAWFEENSGGAPKPVGHKLPNAWGLYDMHGNVWEWCNDVYSETYYAQSGNMDPCNDTTGEERVLRGGGFESPNDRCRSSTRFSEPPGLADVCFGYDAYGFRCVKRVVDEATVSSDDQPRDDTAGAG